MIIQEQQFTIRKNAHFKQEFMLARLPNPYSRNVAYSVKFEDLPGTYQVRLHLVTGLDHVQT